MILTNMKYWNTDRTHQIQDLWVHRVRALTGLAPMDTNIMNSGVDCSRILRVHVNGWTILSNRSSWRRIDSFVFFIYVLRFSCLFHLFFSSSIYPGLLIRKFLCNWYSDNSSIIVNKSSLESVIHIMNIYSKWYYTFCRAYKLCTSVLFVTQNHGPIY